MGKREDVVRRAIEEKYGSIPKMASEIGLAKNTIYHALERGLENTTTKTRSMIIEAVYGHPPYGYYRIDFEPDEGKEHERRELRELEDLYSQMDEHGRAVLLSTARALVRR